MEDTLLLDLLLFLRVLFDLLKVEELEEVGEKGPELFGPEMTLFLLSI